MLDPIAAERGERELDRLIDRAASGCGSTWATRPKAWTRIPGCAS